MTETPDQRDRRELKELEGKNIAHYSVLLAAWISTKMERDKALITLSAAGIGLLVTILTAIGIKQYYELFLFVCAFIGFITTIFSSLKIYDLNSEHIASNIGGSSERDLRFEKYDKRSKWGFIIGVTFSVLIAIVSAINHLELKEEEIMSENKNKSSISSKPILKKKSLDGLTDLRPENVTNQSDSQTTTDNSTTSDEGSSSGDNKE